MYFSFTVQTGWYHKGRPDMFLSVFWVFFPQKVYLPKSL